MFELINKNIRNKLLFIVLIAFIIILLSVFRGFGLLNQVIDEYGNAVNKDVEYLKQISTLNISFKTQVQEWKNTLIRGQDPEQLNKYWGRFNKNADNIRQGYENLLQMMDPQHSAYQKVSAFATAYPPMIRAYRAGYQQFVQSGNNILLADKAVKGIDRAPTQSLNQALEQAKKAVVEQSHAINSRAVMAKNTTIATVIIATIVSLIIFVIFVERRLLKPINQVTRISKLIAAGDFTQSLESHTNDQIGVLSQNIVLIQKDLGGVVSQVVKDLKQLTKLIDSLFDAFHAIKESLGQQTSETELLGNKMSEMKRTSENIDTSIHQANSFVQQSMSKAEQGSSTFEDNLTVNRNMLNATINASDIITGLKQDSDEIGNVVNVINGIAEQTNLLALNAAIEAARAGENGRGFAVVADEVRSLASKTQESTTQISQTIAGLQQAADQAVAAMSEGTKQASISVEQAQQAQAFIQSMNQEFQQIGSLNSQVEGNVQEQLQQTEAVYVGLQKIDDMSDRSQHEAAVMEDASKVLSDILQRINKATKVFKLPEGKRHHPQV